MSFKLLQFPPQASTRSMRVPLRWMELDQCLGANQFLSSWLGDDHDSDQPRWRVNWGVLAGVAISFLVGGGFWAGVGVLIARSVR